MGAITENELRRILKDKDLTQLKEFELPKGTIITPSARSFLADKHIKLKLVDKKEEDEIKNTFPSHEEKMEEIRKKISTLKYRLLNGGYINYKPEHMTSLNGDILVNKDHKRIIFRGKLDSFESKILEVQSSLSQIGYQKLAEDLQDVLDFVRKILKCEVLDSPVHEISILGMSEKEIREMSHHPKKYFNEGHFIPDYHMGYPMVLLNSLRSLTREVEIAAYQAFKKENGEIGQGDIILALNRLSSLFYVLMFKYKTGQYD